MAFLAKIAVELKRAVDRRSAEGGGGSSLISRVLAHGNGWNVEDLLCTSGRHDRPFEEQHASVSIAVVLAGTFQYRAAAALDCASHLMTPGSLLLGNPGQSFECGHQHAAGDRCLSFHFSADYFETIAADTGLSDHERSFPIARLGVVRDLSPVIARASAGLVLCPGEPQRSEDWNSWWEEVGLELAALAVRTANRSAGRRRTAIPGAVARITRIVRNLEEHPGSDPSVRRLALDAGLSPYHFLRTFEQLTGVTPHRYIRRMRLRRAAAQLFAERKPVLDVVMDCGFGDVSNFNRAFRSEFGVSPRQLAASGRISCLHFDTPAWLED
jgi:AraC family transcriptional regulator